MTKESPSSLRVMMLSGIGVVALCAATFLITDSAIGNSATEEKNATAPAEKATTAPAEKATAPAGKAAASQKEGKTAQKLWATVCEEDKDKKKKTCFASQDHRTSEGKLALRFSFGYMEQEKKPFIVTMLPLGINLQSGPVVKISTNKPIPLVLQNCTPDGCLGAVQLDATQTEELLKAKEVSVIMLPGGATQPISFNVNMEGFAKEVKHLP